jgi:teichuronic acid biosynthesis glycosyltransferase TuaH
MEAKMPLTFVYTPTLDWGFLHQRPQQIARALAQRGHTFYYSQKTQQRGVAPRPLDSAERVIIVHDWEAFQEQITDDMIIYASWGMYHTLAGRSKLLVFDHLDQFPHWAEDNKK